MLYIEVIPAYGRDYKSQAEVKKAWNANVDFRIADIAYGGGYITKREATKAGVKIIVRYANLRKVVSV